MSDPAAWYRILDACAAFLADRLDEAASGAEQLLDHIKRSRAKGLRSTAWDEQEADAYYELRIAEAGHAILARYNDCLRRMEDDEYPAGVAADQAREYEDFVIPNLAAVYSDHPDYDPAWAVS